MTDPGRLTATERAETRRTGDPRTRWALTIVHSPDPSVVGVQYELGREGLSVGRDPTGVTGRHLAVQDPKLSRQHVVFALVHGAGPSLQDSASTNGTFRNGARVGHARLELGDVVRVGNTVAVVETLPPPPDAGAADVGLLGSTLAIHELSAAIRRVAPTRISVLVAGPTGTGKELVARAIHRLSGRRGRLVALNGAAIPETLAESTLFGHARGAFTGAQTPAPGAFVEAHQGTLFLDEIGEMSPAIQAKLLRALETGEILPVGGARPHQVDVRVVAATNRRIEPHSDRAGFRADLYARLAGVVLSTVPLAERRADIVPLLRHFLNDDRPITADLAEALLLRPWPLNVRELKSLAERLPVMHPHAAEWDVDALPAPHRPPDDASAPAVFARLPPDRAELLDALQRYDGNISRIARDAGRSRKQVHRWLAAHGLDAASWRDPPEG